MKIAHIDTERTWRGGEQQVFSLIEGLKAKGHQNLAIVRRHSELSKRLDGVATKMEVCPWGEWDFVAAHFLNRRLKAEQVDVVHAHSAHGVALAAFATLGTNIPVVITRRVDFHIAKNPLSRWKYRRAARIVAISEGVKRILIQDGISEKVLPVVPSGVDFKRFGGVRAVSKSELQVPANAIVIGQVAALAPHKDQNNLLEAAAIIKKEFPLVHFVVVGEGSLRSMLEKKSKALGVADAVHFIGFRDRPLDYLAAFHYFCLSSKEEGLGTSLLDAMALKIPIVATAVGGVPELIEDGVTGYLAPGSNPEALAFALKRAIQSPEKIPLILARAVEKAHEFDILNTISRMEAIYAELSTHLPT